MTGGLGFIGRALTKSLSFEGHKVVAGVRFLPNIADQLSGITYEIYNENTNCENILNQHQIDVVVHLATTYDLSDNWQSMEKMIDSNYKLMLNILCSCLSRNIPVVTAGTYTQHSSSEAGPTSIYALLKNAASLACKFYATEKHMSIIELRLFDTYGEADTRAKFINLLIRAGLDGKVLNASPGGQLIDLVYIDDVVAAFKSAVNNILQKEGHSYRIYEVASRKPITLQSLSKKVEEQFGQKLEVNWGYYPYRKNEMFEYSSKFPLLPDWHQTVELERGIQILLSEDKI